MLYHPSGTPDNPEATDTEEDGVVSPGASSVYLQKIMKPQDLRLPLVHSERVFAGGYLQVDRERFGEGEKPQVREIVRVRDGVCVLAVTSDGFVPVVAQFRAAIGHVIAELPAGVVDPGEEPLEAARRELSEEAGCHGGTWTHLRHYAQAEGYSNGWMDLYLATGCERGDSHPEEGEELVLEFRPLKALYDGIASFSDAKSILSLLLARPHLSALGTI